MGAEHFIAQETDLFAGSLFANPIELIPSWAGQIEVRSTASAGALVMDGAGNLYVGGSRDGALLAGTTSLDPPSATSAFVLSLDRNGAARWMVDAAPMDAPTGLNAFDAAFVNGALHAAIVAPGGAALLSFAGADGSRAVEHALIGAEGITAIDTTATSIDMVGVFRGSIDAGSGVPTLESVGGSDVFLARYDVDGTPRSLNGSGTPDDDGAQGFVDLPSARVILRDGILIALDPEGAVAWQYDIRGLLDPWLIRDPRHDGVLILGVADSDVHYGEHRLRLLERTTS